MKDAHAQDGQFTGVGSEDYLLSIVIPCYNAMPYIQQALETVSQWPADEVEILVQDGGSTDGTLEAVRRFGSRVSLVSEPDRGQTDALNKAIKRSRGKYVGWLNADDLYLPGMWQAVRPIILGDDSPDAIYGNWSNIFENGDVMREMQLADLDWSKFIVKGIPVWSGAILWNRSVFEEYGYFAEEFHYCMDAEFIWRVAGRITTRFVPVEFGRYRIHDASKTGSSPWAFFREEHRIRSAHLGSSFSGRVLTLATDARQAFYYATKDFRYSRFWSRLRRRHSYS